MVGKTSEINLGKEESKNTILQPKEQIAQSKLKKSEHIFRRPAENAPDVIYRYRFVPGRGFEYLSRAATKNNRLYARRATAGQTKNVGHGA